MSQEIEAKIALRPGEMRKIRARLIELAAEPGPVDEEENLIFDIKVGGQGRRRLRLRTFGDRDDAILTYKRPARSESAFKAREEYELRISDAAAARELLHQLGFQPRIGYRKRREHWFIGSTTVALDQLAFGDYVEVEGEPCDIDSTLTLLGLSRRRHIDSGYPRLAKRSLVSETAQLGFPTLLARAS